MSVKKRFELHQVLNYRLEVEKVRKLEFAAAKREYELASDKLLRVKDTVKALQEEFTAKQGQINTIDELQMYADYFARKKEEIKLQQERVEALDRIMDDKRNEMLEATKDKKVLESLKDKQEKAFKLSQEQKERNFLDEISIQKKGSEH